MDLRAFFPFSHFLLQHHVLLLKDGFAGSAGWAIAVFSASIFKFVSMGCDVGCIVTEDFSTHFRFCESNETVDWHDVCFNSSDVGLIGLSTFVASEPCFCSSFCFGAAGWCCDQIIGLFNNKIKYGLFHKYRPPFCFSPFIVTQFLIKNRLNNS